jgi:hypothetical protein
VWAEHKPALTLSIVFIGCDPLGGVSVLVGVIRCGADDDVAVPDQAFSLGVLRQLVAFGDRVDDLLGASAPESSTLIPAQPSPTETLMWPDGTSSRARLAR